MLEPLLRWGLPASLTPYVNSLNQTLSLGVLGGWLVALASPASAEVILGRLSSPRRRCCWSRSAACSPATGDSSAQTSGER